MSTETRKWKLQMNEEGDRGTVRVQQVQLSVSFDDQVSGKEAFGDDSAFGSASFHNRYEVTAVNLITGDTTSWKFHDSIANTMDKSLFPVDLGYSILACVRADFYYTQERFPTFEDFCAEFGYDTDSRRAERIYKASLEVAEKLNKVFTEDIIETLPE